MERRQAERHGSVVHANGERYDGEWKNDLPNGEGILTRADGSKLEGDFLDGKLTQATHWPPAPALPPPSRCRWTATPAGKPPPTQSPLGQPVGQEADRRWMAPTLNLTAIEGGIERDITAANGALEKTTFTFINDQLGTVAADGGQPAPAAPMSPAFSASPTMAWKIRYADGRGEILSASWMAACCCGWRRRARPLSAAPIIPTGTAFSDAEKKAAVAEYAIRLGLAPAGDQDRPAPAMSPIARRRAANRARPASPSHAEAPSPGRNSRRPA